MDSWVPLLSLITEQLVGIQRKYGLLIPLMFHTFHRGHHFLFLLILGYSSLVNNVKQFAKESALALVGIQRKYLE